MTIRATVLLLCLLLFNSARDTQAQTAANAEVANALQQILDSEFLAQFATGKSIAIVFPDRSIWTGTAGYSVPSTQVPIQPDHLFGFASITKTYVSAAVMKLVEEGILNLDDTLSMWISPLTYVNSGITIRQLLGHTSGVYNYTNHPDLFTTIRANPQTVWQPVDILTQFIGPPAFFAGTGASYSNSNYTLTQMVIEAATGQTLGEVIRTRLLDGAELSDTFFAMHEASIGEFATTWVDVDGNGTLDNFSDLFDSPSLRSARGAAGGMVATASDVALWAQKLYSGEVLDSGSLTEVLNFHNLAGQNSTWTGYGLGAQQYSISGIEMWGHSGLVSGATSLMLYSPALDLSIALVDNNAFSNHFSTARALVAYLGSLTFTAVEDFELPSKFDSQVYPNPSPLSAAVTFEVSATITGPIYLEVFDLTGRRIYSTKVNAHPGATLISWRPEGGLTAGAYVYRIASEGQLLESGSLIRAN